jgi:O-acetyl-ADP-ribose deacetylase (regulator of RNase III)
MRSISINSIHQHYIWNQCNECNSFSVIGVSYIIGQPISTKYENVYPGTACIEQLTNNLWHVKENPSNNHEYIRTTDTPSECFVKYVINAAPASSTNTYSTIKSIDITNSVLNSIILAAKNNVDIIYFPIIGAGIFLPRIENDKVHLLGLCELLLKGLTQYTNAYFTDPKFNSKTAATDNLLRIHHQVKEIVFVAYTDLELDAMKHAITNMHLNSNISVIKPYHTSTTDNMINHIINNNNSTKVTAIVNAANTELLYGANVSSMIYTAIGGETNTSNTVQQKLLTMKETFMVRFVELMNVYNETNFKKSKDTKVGGHPKTKKKYTNAHIHAYSKHHSYTRKKHIPNSIRANHNLVTQLHMHNRCVNTHRAIRKPRVYDETRKYMRYKDIHFNKSVANKRRTIKSKSLKNQTKL